MGTFLHSVQIQNRKDRLLQYYEEPLQQYFVNQMGLNPCGEKDANVVVCLVLSADKKWVGLYCENIEREEASLAALSRLFETPCIEIDVFDSDLLTLQLSDMPNGIQDRIIFGDPAVLKYFGLDSDKTAQGNPRMWESLLIDGVTTEAFQALWQQEFIFAEDVLVDICEALCLPCDMALTPPVDIWEVEGVEILPLYFISEKLIKRPRKGMPPELKISSWNNPWRADSDPSIAFYNAGDETVGLTVVYRGACLKDDEVTIQNIHIFHGIYEGSAPEDVPATVEKVQRECGSYSICATFPDLMLPANGIEMDGRVHFDSYDKQISVRCTVAFGDIEEAMLDVIVIPLANWNDGQAGICVTLQNTSLGDGSDW
ncbi:hypothetical protein LJC20_01915 [Eubacteriales bacterium OttesenSCG-928-M02]|nr:hypothetical protein [Eubacteriales bacterium OttesenSCG-928-M02]